MASISQATAAGSKSAASPTGGAASLDGTVSVDGAADGKHADAGGGGGPPRFTPSTTLKSRSYWGLLLSQFLAAFNDQASHIVALFYATDMLVRFAGVPGVDTKTLISIVTACFITPFFLFSPLAGVLADKYSKRSIIVFWKVTEVGIMGIALLGFLLPHTVSWGWMSPHALAICSSILVISVVFLMGTHSAFFVPAKYGMMPEILHTSVLSRGNGMLEGTSFTANILGTVFGGWLYGTEFIKSKFDPTFVPGNEWIIGVVLFSFAIIGAIASLLVARIPAAAPDNKLVLEPWTPMKQNLGMLKKSRPLVIATFGIAFFLFMTLFLRQSLLFQGETAEEIQIAKRIEKPPAAAATAAAMADVTKETPADDDTERTADATAPIKPETIVETPHEPATKTEFEVAFLLGLVGLGVGIGCYLAGYFSGNRLELGLVPIGIVLLIGTTAVMAAVSPAKTRMIFCLIAVGMSAGLYIVPLYTLLQHRRPKTARAASWPPAISSTSPAGWWP